MTKPPRLSVVSGQSRSVSWLWTAIRIRTLSMAAVPVLAGSALAWAEGASYDLPVLFITLACAVLIQIGTNLFNDVADAVRGNDGPERVGPTRVTATGLATPQQVRRAAIHSFMLALLLGAYLVSLGGWTILLLGLTSLFAGWAYSGGPRPLSYTAWGEVAVIVFFGIVAVLGSHYLQSGRLASSAMFAGLVLGAPAAAVLLVNNVRDVDADRQVGRSTLAAVLGPVRSRRLYLLLMLAPFPLLPLLGQSSAAWAALTALPVFLWLGWRFLGLQGGAGFNAQLVRTAQAQMLLGVLLCGGLLW